ncbi:hypothetical protein CVT25_006154 [Psilocybe cyanescens]|uniref:Uncharacterized protein n=1 Tax=Psilocybe cyanescens TaxID=93625 RepID=A0A409WYX5_PSICY|nr:hypothetical protein CVT25_006154 [Psilocybe cyanescens]
MSFSTSLEKSSRMIVVVEDETGSSQNPLRIAGSGGDTMIKAIGMERWTANCAKVRKAKDGFGILEDHINPIRPRRRHLQGETEC